MGKISRSIEVYTSGNVNKTNPKVIQKTTSESLRLSLSNNFVDGDIVANNGAIDSKINKINNLNNVNNSTCYMSTAKTRQNQVNQLAIENGSQKQCFFNDK